MLLVLVGDARRRGGRDRQGRGYRVDRIDGFLDQSTGVDPDRAAAAEYSLNESKIAIVQRRVRRRRACSRAAQTNLAYVPEQHTDFIFTVVGEELGFVGGATLIGLYGLLVWRLWRTALLSSDFFGTLLASACWRSSRSRCSRTSA